MFDWMTVLPTRREHPDASLDAAPSVAESAAVVIRSIITELACVPLDDLPDQELRRETVELAGVLASLQAQVFRRVAAVAGRAGSEQRRRPGGSAGDVVGWLRSQVGLAPAEAHRWVRTAEGLYPRSPAPEPAPAGGDLPDDAAQAERDRAPTGRAAPGTLSDTREALELGVITTGHAEVITRTLRTVNEALRREARANSETRGDPDPSLGTAQASGGDDAGDDDSGAREQLLAEVEALLLTRAKNADVAELSRVAMYARNTLDPVGSRRERMADEAERFLETSSTSTGGLRLRGYLTGASAASLRAALDSFSAPAPADDVTPDPRTASQRRADALGEISRRVLRAGEGGSVGGVRPHVQVLVPLPALSAVGGGSAGTGGPVFRETDRTDHSTDHRHNDNLDVDQLAGLPPEAGGAAAPGGLTTFGQVLDQETIRQLACDATLTRLVVPEAPGIGRLADRGALIRMLSAPSRPLDVGRSERSVTTAMRIALIARDRHCAFPGCDRPHTWCDAHHVRHWADGGATSLDNLVLLCGRHHTAVHHDGWRVAIEQGSGLPVFRPPQGTERPERRRGQGGTEQSEDPSRTRQGPPTLAAFRPWGGSAG